MVRVGAELVCLTPDGPTIVAGEVGAPESW